MKQVNKINVIETILSEEVLSEESMSVIVGGANILPNEDDNDVQNTFLDDCNCSSKR